MHPRASYDPIRVGEQGKLRACEARVFLPALAQHHSRTHVVPHISRLALHPRLAQQKSVRSGGAILASDLAVLG